MTRTNTWANVVWHNITSAHKHEKKVTCEVYCLHDQHPDAHTAPPSARTDPEKGKQAPNSPTTMKKTLKLSSSKDGQRKGSTFKTNHTNTSVANMGSFLTGRSPHRTKTTVEEKFLSLDPISSARVHRVICYFTSGKMKGRRTCRKIRMKKGRKVKLMIWSRKSERSLNSCVRHGDDHGMEWDANANILSRCAMCKGWVWQQLKQRLTTKTDCNNYAHAHVCPKCFKSLHTLLGFVLCFVLILCFVSLMVFLSLWSSIRIPNSCIFHIAKTGSFEVLSLQPLRRNLDHPLRILAGINLCSTTARKSAPASKAKSPWVSQPPTLNNSTETPKDRGPGCPARPIQRYHKMTPQNLQRELRQRRTTLKREKGLTMCLPAISQECPLIQLTIFA